VAARLAAPLTDRVRLAALPAPATPATLAGRRVGAGLGSLSVCCQDANKTTGLFGPANVSSSSQDLIALMDRLHAIVGSRVTYVADFPYGYPGLVYFLADLRPAPIPLDPYTMVVTHPQMHRFLAVFRTSVLGKTQAVITSWLHTPEAADFLRRYPSASRVTLRYRNRNYYVLLRRA
jgi:hypothetical protein